MENTPGGTSPGTSGGNDVGSVVTEKVQQGAQQAVQGTQQAVNQVTQQAQQQATSFFQNQKSQATGTLDAVAHAFRQTGDNLRNENQPAVAGLADRAADTVEGVSGYLQQRDIGDFVYEAENYARNNTWLFLGGAFTLGLLAARFLKSSSPQSGSSNYGGGHGGYGQGYSQRNYGYGSAGGQSYGNGMPSGQYDYGTTPHRFEDVGNIPPVQRGYAAGQAGRSSISSTGASSSDLTDTDTLLETDNGSSSGSY